MMNNGHSRITVVIVLVLGLLLAAALAVAGDGKNSVKLDIRDLGDDGRVEIVMPWSVAECLLGRTVVMDDSMGKIKVKVKGENGGTFEFKVD